MSSPIGCSGFSDKLRGGFGSSSSFGTLEFAKSTLNRSSLRIEVTTGSSSVVTVRGVLGVSVGTAVEERGSIVRAASCSSAESATGWSGGSVGGGDTGGRVVDSTIDSLVVVITNWFV